MVKVLHVLEHSFPKLAGYTVRAKYIIDNQKKEGLHPVVITSPLQGKTKRSVKDYEEIDFVRYYRTGCFNRLNMGEPIPLRLARRYAYSRAYLKAIMWVAKKENIQIIHSHSSYLNGVRGNQAAKAAGIPSVYEVRGLWQDTASVNADINPDHWKYRFVSHMDRKAMTRADRVVTLSRRLKEELIRMGVDRERLHVVPNGVDTQIFRPRERSPEIEKRYKLKDKITFGFIGSIRRIEGLSLFLENLRRIIARTGNVCVLLVGDGDEVPHLKKIVEKQDLSNYVYFTGRINHDQIFDYYTAIDIFLYPRIDAKVNHKVTPLKPLEAMAMEKIVLASDVGGLAELVTDGSNGFLFRVGDGDHLVRRCLELIEKPSLRETIGRQARQWTVRKRDWQTIIKRYETIYSNLSPIPCRKEMD